MAIQDNLWTPKNLESFVENKFEPIGKWFELFNSIRHQGDLGYHESDDEVSSESDDEKEEHEETPEYLEYLQSLDPKNWKDQDHYKVLGLEKLRYKATQNQIKKAHKQKVLKHHPDKMTNADTKEREYFTCITKALEILSDPIKRCAFDSVDPEFDDDVPPVNESNKKNFYKVFGEVFERNSRWSIKKHVPKLGDDKSTFEEVNKFYGFWYDFDSWRQYSYLDEENKETAADRDERRWIDKQNKAERAKRKKEEVARLRQLVDNAYACDPRIAKFKQDEKKKKEDEKNKRREAARQREAEEAKKLEEVRLQKEREEEAAKQKLEAEKKEREQMKKALKKERKNLRTTCKDHNYFAKTEEERIGLLDRIEAMIESLNLEDLQTLNQAIEPVTGQEEKIKAIVIQKLEHEENILKLKRQQLLEESASGASKSSAATASAQNVSAQWSDDEIKLLVKAVQIIPVGTRNRWEVIANFILEHSKGKFKRTEKEVLTKTKEMQSGDSKIKEEANKKAYEKTLQNIKAPENLIQEKPSERFISPGEQLLAEQGSNPAPWSAEEQKILEQALKTFPSTLADRWDKVAECLPARSKKDCMLRYKELVEIIMAKKKAQTKAATAK